MCAHRHATLEKQIANIERIVKDLDVRARESRIVIIKSIGIAIAVMTSVVSGVIFLIERLG